MAFTFRFTPWAEPRPVIDAIRLRNNHFEYCGEGYGVAQMFCNGEPSRDVFVIGEPLTPETQERYRVAMTGLIGAVEAWVSPWERES